MKKIATNKQTIKEITKNRRQLQDLERLETMLDGLKGLSGGVDRISERIENLMGMAEEYGRFRRAVSELAAPELIEEICQAAGIDHSTLEGKQEQSPAVLKRELSAEPIRYWESRYPY